MKKLLLLSLAVVFAGSVFSQKTVDKNLSAFQLKSNHTIYNSNAQLLTKGITANLNESFNIFTPSGWSADPTTGRWEGSATWTYSSAAGNFGDGVFAVMDCFNISAGEEGSLITPFLHPVSGNNTLSYDIIEILLNPAYISTGLELYIEFSQDGSTWTTSSTNVLTTVTLHNDSTIPQTTTTLTTDLSAYDNDSVQVRFRCVSDYGGFSLFLDNVTGPEASINLLTNEISLNHAYLDVDGFDYYAIVPFSQFINVKLKASTANLGSANQTNVTFHADDATNSLNLTSTPQTLNTATTDTLDIDVTAPIVTTSYAFATNVSQTETDENTSNNVGDTIKFNAHPTYYNRVNNLTGLLTPYSFGAAAPAVDKMEYGANYYFSANTVIDTISVLIYGASGTGTVVGRVYKVDNTGARTLLGETLPYTPTGSPELKKLVLTSQINVSFGQILTAAVQLNVNIAANDTIKIGSDNNFVGNSSLAGAVYLQVAGQSSMTWHSITGTVPFVGFIIDTQVSVDEVMSNARTIVYPNPNTGLLNITNAKNATVNVYNMVGEVVATATNVSTMDISNLENGTYIVKVISDSNITTTKITLTK